jgi:hypothetical protein
LRGAGRRQARQWLAKLGHKSLFYDSPHLAHGSGMGKLVGAEANAKLALPTGNDFPAEALFIKLNAGSNHR